MFRIGEFSKLCKVSVKTLHHYDKIDLFKPKTVDTLTGYRYYEAEQINMMLYIQRLKRYGFSLDEIQELIFCNDNNVLHSRLIEQMEKLRKEQIERDMILKELRSHLLMFERTDDIMTYMKNYSIEVKHSPKLDVVVSRQMMGVHEFGKYFGILFERIAREQIQQNRITGAIYYDDKFDHQSSDIEVFIGVENGNKADKFVGGELCAFTVHKGAYSNLSEAYGALTAWIESSSYEMSGAPYELYVKTQFDGLKPEDWETEIYFPIKEA